MPFFDRREAPESTPWSEVGLHIPDWWDEPNRFLGGVVSAQFLLAQTDALAITVREIVAYPTGFSMTVRIVARDGHTLPAGGPHLGPRSPNDDSPHTGFRFGLLHANGTKIEASWQARYFGGDVRRPPDLGHFSELDTPPQPFLAPSGGSGGSRLHWYGGYWSAPLPPRGPLEFAAEWLDGGVPETTATMDADAILDAARTSRPIWDL